MATKTTPEAKAAAKATKPTFLVINDVLYYQSKAGDELALDLDFPSSILEKAMAGDLDQRDQFLLMLDAMGDSSVVSRVKEMGALEQLRLITGFFKEFHAAVDVTPGE